MYINSQEMSRSFLLEVDFKIFMNAMIWCLEFALKYSIGEGSRDHGCNKISNGSVMGEVGDRPMGLLILSSVFLWMLEIFHNRNIFKKILLCFSNSTSRYSKELKAET